MILRQEDLLSEQRAGAHLLEIWAIGAAIAGALAGIAGGVVAMMIVGGGHVSGAARSIDAPRPVSADPPPASGRAKMVGSVLIVDDDARIRELVRRWLAPHELELRQAADAKSALAAVVFAMPMSPRATAPFWATRLSPA